MSANKWRLKADKTRSPDKLDRRILKPIINDRRYWVPSEIAEELKEPESTIQKRVDRLKEEQRLQDVTTVDLSAAGFPLRYRIDIKINPRELRENKGGQPDRGEKHTFNSQKGLARYIMHVLPLEKRFRNRVIVEDVTIVLGDPADLCATLRVQTHQDAFRFVTEGLRALGGVENTSTSQEAWSVLTGDVSEYIEDLYEDEADQDAKSGTSRII